MARHAVVLDACVLVPVALADTLLRIAERDLYRPSWSARIVAEAIAAIVEIHPDIPPEQVQRRFLTMDDAFEDACVNRWENLEDTVTLPDPDDFLLDDPARDRSQEISAHVLLMGRASRQKKNDARPESASRLVPLCATLTETASSRSSALPSARPPLLIRWRRSTTSVRWFCRAMRAGASNG